MPRALLSVYDKILIVPLANKLSQLGYDLVASGGTARVLKEAGLEVISVEEVTQSPECLGGRVKTLHPAIHAGILARETSADRADLEKMGWEPFEVVVCNLYPFQQAVAKGLPDDEVIEQIDIGGVALIRAAAKNYKHVVVLTDPADYAPVIEHGVFPNRRKNAQKAFQHTNQYDRAISDWFLGKTPNPALTIAATLQETPVELRYGENAHQPGFLFPAPGFPFKKIQGEKELGYNNWLDIDAAWEIVSYWGAPAVAVIKHTNPCGVAVGSSPADALGKALGADNVSSFGSVIAVNRTVTKYFVEGLGKRFIEAIVARHFEEDALELLEKRKNCRVVTANAYPTLGYFGVRSIFGGVLAQMSDSGSEPDWDWVTETKAVDRFPDLEFAWRVVRHVKSNAIVLAKDKITVGVGAGQMNRVKAVQLAIEQAGEIRASRSVLASDAFFPFADSIELAAKAGVEAIIQPGGSKRDQEVIDAANAHGIPMLFTHQRHFKH